MLLSLAIWPIRGKHRSDKDSGESFIKTTLRNLFIYVVFLVVLSLSNKTFSIKN